MKDQLESKLNELWDGTIKSFEINFYNHSICIEQSNTIGGEIFEHDIRFEGVSSFYYVAGDDDLRFDPPEWERVELTEIVYRKKEESINHFRSSEDRHPSNSTTANFAIGIWSSTLLIEAKSIVIDGHRFDVGYPK